MIWHKISHADFGYNLLIQLNFNFLQLFLLFFLEKNVIQSRRHVFSSGLPVKYNASKSITERNKGHWKIGLRNNLLCNEDNSVLKKSSFLGALLEKYTLHNNTKGSRESKACQVA